jgi:4-amino-4-deoxy-L-arabinose transferase-like glycosyltransferase
MAAVLLIGLRRPLGLPGALVAAVAATMSTLTLYYGRLALLEPVVSLTLCVAAVAAIRATASPSVRRWAVACGVAFGIAVALKVNALASMVGILGAVGLLGLRTPRLRGFVGIALGIVAVVVVGWVFFVAIPNIEQLSATVAASPIDSVPTSPGGWLANMRGFLISNDGLVGLTWPILTAAVAGVIVVAWDHAGRAGRTGALSDPAIVALIGGSWAVIGLIGVASFGYQPNRYVVPLLPGLALVVGAAVSVVDRRTVGQPGSLRGLASVAIVGLLAIPGLVAHAGWVISTGRTEIEGQAAVEAIVPAGAHLGGGYAPLFAMRLPVTTTFTIGDRPLNQGDLYVAGVRWFVVEAGAPPPVTGRHLAAWAARQERWCTTWGRDETGVCLVELP